MSEEIANDDELQCLRALIQLGKKTGTGAFEPSTMEAVLNRLEAVEQQLVLSRDAVVLAYQNCNSLKERIKEQDEKLTALLVDPNYEGGVQFWICKHDELAVDLAQKLVTIKDLESALATAQRDTRLAETVLAIAAANDCESRVSAEPKNVDKLLAARDALRVFASGLRDRAANPPERSSSEENKR